MAELNIKITTDYKQTQQAFTSVSDNVKKYRNELTKAESVQKAEQKALDDYINSLTKRLRKEEETKEGIAKLNAQAKILKNEIFELNGAFGDGNEVSKHFDKQLDMVKKSMAGLKDTAKKTAKEGLAEVEKSSGNAATKLLSVAKNILKFQLLMGPITAVIRGFKNTLSDSVKLAAEAEQRFSKLATVFDGLAQSAKQAASAIASELGVATSTAASALSTVGDLLQAQGMGTAESLNVSSDWVKKFQDIIAFKDINMSLEEFAQNFMSGAAGNLRNFRTFGSIVKESAVNARLASEGLDQLTGSELELAKMTARANIALEQQENAIGATEREWDTMLSVNRRLNEAWKEYKENLGNTFNTILKPMKTWITEILDATNKTGRILKEIEGGEFTIKVEQSLTEDFSNTISSTLLSVASGLNYNSFLGKANEALALAGGATMGQVYPINQLSASQIRDVMLSTGATRSQVESVVSKAGFSVPKEVYDEAERLANTYKEQKKAADEVTASLLTMGQNTDTFTEALASLAHINFTSSSFEQALGKENIDFFNMDEIAGRYGQLSSHAVSRAIRIATEQMAGLGSDAFANPIDLMFGTNNKADDLSAWMDEVKKLYELLLNRQKKFGDVTDEELGNVANLWKSINDELERYNKQIQIDNALSSANSTMVSALSGYHRLKYENGLTGTDAEKAYRMSVDWDIPLKIQEFSRAMRDAGVPLEKVVEKSKEYEKILKDEAKLKLEIATKAKRDALLGGYRDKAAGYRQQMANIGLSDAQITRNGLQAELQAAYDSRDRSLYYTIKDTIKAFDDLQAKLKEVEIAEAWRSLGDKALGSLGTVGGAIQTFRGEGDIWSKILNVCIDILSQSEKWSELVGILDKVFAPLLPLVEGIVNTLTSLNWFWDTAITAIRIIASVVAGIMRGVEYVLDVFQWLWDNLKVALNNIYQAIIHPISKGSQQEYKELASYWEDTNKTYDEILNKIWTDMPKENDNLALLKDLYDRNIINEDQFYAGARVVQKDKIFDPVSPSSNSYVTYGNVTIYVNGGDPTELRRTLEDFFNENGMNYNMAYGRA